MRKLGYVTVLLLLAACGSDTGTDPGDDTFPQALSALGITGTEYAPRYPLWTNGSAKIRTVTIPNGATINTSDRDRWTFPDGTVFSKTFAYGQQGGGAPRKIETRIIRVRNGAFETAAYLWNADQSDAALLSNSRNPVAVTDAQGNRFSHVVPSAADCQDCHAPAPAFILGFNELQLNTPLAGATITQLQSFADAGVWSAGMPDNPATIVGDDTTSAVIGYAQGNCVHCHNGTGLVDFSYDVFLANTIDQMAALGGFLIRPQQPDSSQFYVRFALGAMPPLGVQLVDDSTVALIRSWIEQY